MIIKVVLPPLTYHVLFQVLVPVIPPVRPVIGNEPFSTFILLNRNEIPQSEKFFLYPIHISSSFLLTKGLNSAVYLMLLRFMHREYAEVFRLADSIATDTNFNEEGGNLFKGFGLANSDMHPDAHACRLKIFLVTIDSGADCPWDITAECGRYIAKLDCVSSCCRLPLEEELQVLRADKIVLSRDSAGYDNALHSDYFMALCYNRKHQLTAMLEQSKGSSGKVLTVAEASESEQLVPCRCPPRTMLNHWPYYQDNTIFGENYATLIDIDSVDDWRLQVHYACSTCEEYIVMGMF